MQRVLVGVLDRNAQGWEAGVVSPRSWFECNTCYVCVQQTCRPVMLVVGASVAKCPCKRPTPPLLHYKTTYIPAVSVSGC